MLRFLPVQRNKLYNEAYALLAVSTLFLIQPSQVYFLQGGDPERTVRSMAIFIGVRIKYLHITGVSNVTTDLFSLLQYFISFLSPFLKEQYQQ